MPPRRFGLWLATFSILLAPLGRPTPQAGSSQGPAARSALNFPQVRPVHS